jgi:hypothetical protein
MLPPCAQKERAAQRDGPEPRINYASLVVGLIIRVNALPAITAVLESLRVALMSSAIRRAASRGHLARSTSDCELLPVDSAIGWGMITQQRQR